MMGMVHSLETGAKRYVLGITDNSLKSGNFMVAKQKCLLVQSLIRVSSLLI
jgi:hypothetical protein